MRALTVVPGVPASTMCRNQTRPVRRQNCEIAGNSDPLKGGFRV